MIDLTAFQSEFKELTGHPSFPWQEELFNLFANGDIPSSCNIPTGLGKTSVIAIWLLALAHHATNGTTNRLPRRLVYVVNRRTVVDQATREAEGIRKALSKSNLQTIAGSLRTLGTGNFESPLALSTLRGQFADNAEWRDDPARPAVIIGTVDMIGSRLLFSGYGSGFKTRPTHAAFLGQETLLVHDEAHLEPAFQELVTAIEAEQKRCRDYRPMRTMALTATSRDGRGQFGLTESDFENDTVKKRVHAKKGIRFDCIDDKGKLVDAIVRHALELKDTGQAILIFLREVSNIEKAVKALESNKQTVCTLTGTLRGFERDKMAKENKIFTRFIPEPRVTAQAGTVYLICTSAGEVGVNISADHLTCDVTPFDSMAQRFGRVNRFGEGDAKIDVICLKGENPPDEKDAESNESSSEADKKTTRKSKTAYDQACERTVELLHHLPKRDDQRYDSSPAALSGLHLADRQAAFTPVPVILPATDILFDTWALTSFRQKLPGRPPVAEWLHGVSEWEPPDTYVAWREEVEIVNDVLQNNCDPEDLIEDFPLKPQEILRDKTARVFDHLEKIAKRCPEHRVWLIEENGTIQVHSLSKLVEKDRQKKPVFDLANCTVLLSPSVGGIKEDGMLNGEAGFRETQLYDVADKWMDENGNPRRCRVWDGEPPSGMRLVRTIDTRFGAEDEEQEDQEPGRRFWRWYVLPRSADDDGSRTARQAQDLHPHLQSARDFANSLVNKLGLREQEAEAVALAAFWHDRGKHRALWQRSIGNNQYPDRVLAKSGGKMRPLDLNHYRHEFGSLLDLSTDAHFRQLEPEMQDLVQHLIAAHHGRARPHFSGDEAFDPERNEADALSVTREIPRRFARLQRKYGRWGLAYLESVLRAADALASDLGLSQSQDSSGLLSKQSQETHE